MEMGIEITDSGCEIINRVGDETDKKATFPNAWVSDQQDLEWKIVVIALTWRRTHLTTLDINSI